MPALILLPAVDVVNGQAVRLTQGEAGTETVYGASLDAARSFVEEGARWLHLVDLDAAFGRGSNAALLQSITAQLPIDVELTGGIRDDESLRRALDAGARRVNLGTAAIENPEWTERVIGRFGDRIALGLDVRGETLSGRGWTTEGPDLFETIARFDAAGCARYVVTDVSRDGMLSGPNIDLLARVCAATDAAVVASGGVSSLDDLEALRGLVGAGLEGAIIGKALYSGRFTLAEALAVAGPQDRP
ncbi:bifunctional 1-(5-phosphoribosyl)-5-((5-phosphoribosylamino)methylideneamino)imidazole-4-carboxamide isomerase/phosphoribosylanthranilate isomerase PriA [Actinomyces sp. B33]|uniref:bifunctional 1-(5-phosphoribosyl)-5-((5- phosphoribosylamino)methylideneamino)imidazole-4- carboxamide isomerase/phosphoribosylanthranilate isomerase PriA n=1 Tax=Actinomyces sp. B33 TaxID=2942131 RepID=UPI002341F72A|nr:bifunctional 1-(5-phosphoribosyl)-5-((5-phosphoribosylamino)methylideneamino)imidazole-4-carboxamide isomerase/phosphoribosylanthranilate isomerase PriA [Actinomyces sp. B33]MDC4233100.1 bifunctional 1-(5-phosphoribosyl)-5-((5-phosphoribosylamino)methylideneamino)imidazole-4-carboxamide isomerase/phosphoribosylanthranilate isomerase PriA [Actinomyces sp. B33]